MEERRFSEEEMAAILRRAADQETPPQLPGQGGFTLNELVAIGQEAGLDPGTLRLAAAVAPSPPSPAAQVLLGAPARTVARARGAGTLDPARHTALAEACERAFGRRGTVEVKGDRWVWSEVHGPGRTTVEVRLGDGVSDVTVEADRQGYVLLTGLGALAVAVVGLQPLGGVLGISLALGLWAGILAPLLVAGVLVRLVYPRLVRGLAQRVERAALDALALVEAGGDSGARDRLPAPDHRHLAPPSGEGGGGLGSLGPPPG